MVVSAVIVMMVVVVMLLPIFQGLNQVVIKINGITSPTNINLLPFGI